MDKPALEAFVAVAECGSFSRAADRLFKTQPALSKRIATLEDELDSQLFDRLGREVRLTEAGERLLGHARRILADLDASRDDVRSLSGDVAGRLRLGTSHHIGLRRLPEVLKDYVQRYPLVELDLSFMDSEDACTEVAAGHLDLAVVTLPEQPDRVLRTELVWPDPLVVMCSAEHAMVAESQGHVDFPITALSDWPAILPAEGTITRSILLDALKPHAVRINTRLESNYLETIRMLVSVGLGWSALPRSMLDDSMVEIPVAGLDMMRRLGLVTHSGRTLSRSALAFRHILIGQ